MSRHVLGTVLCLTCAGCGVYGTLVDLDRLHLGMTPTAAERAVGAPYRSSGDGTVQVFRYVKVTFFDSRRVDTVLVFGGGRLEKVYGHGRDPRVPAEVMRQLHMVQTSAWYALLPDAGGWTAGFLDPAEEAELARRVREIAPKRPVFARDAPGRTGNAVLW